MDEYEKRMLTQLQELNKTASEILKKLDFLAGEKLKKGHSIRPQKTKDKPEP